MSTMKKPSPRWRQWLVQTVFHHLGWNPMAVCIFLHVKHSCPINHLLTTTCQNHKNCQRNTFKCLFHALLRSQVSWPHLQAHTHTHIFKDPFFRTTRVILYQKGKTNLDFTKERDHVCTSLQTDNHGSTPPLSFLQVRCPSCHPTNSVKALKAPNLQVVDYIIWLRCLPLAVILNLSETTAYKWKINNFKSSVYFWHLKYMH